MPYGFLVDATVLVHLAFLGYVVAGGFLAWRWRRTIWLHVAAVAWGFATVLVGFDCPLTHLENWAGARPGAATAVGRIHRALPDRVLYPTDALDVVRALVALGVVASWIGFVTLRHRGSGRRAPV
ncbi:DUF2784 family protein [Rhodococcus hoagii]|nr:DUF2784 family protein [Prescottella equi]